MAVLSPQLKQRFFTAAGVPLAGGKLYSYAAGTTTPLATYTDYGGGSANANPVILDANGECDLWLGSLAYKFILKNSADVTQWTVDNVNQGTISTRASSMQVENLGIVCSVLSNAMTIALTDAAGSTPSSDSPVKIGFRSSTLTSGLSSTNSTESATAIVLPSGASLGLSNGVNGFIYVYAINNSGVTELAVSRRYFAERVVVSTTAITSGATSSTVLYSTTARTNVPIRLIGRLISNQTTAGVYALLPTEVQTGDEALRGENVCFTGSFNSGNASSTPALVTITGVEFDPYNMNAGGTNGWVVPWDGWYTIYASAYMNSFVPAADFSSQLSLYLGSALYKVIEEIDHASRAGVVHKIGSGALRVYLKTTDAWDFRLYQNTGANKGVYSGSDYAAYNYIQVVAER